MASGAEGARLLCVRDGRHGESSESLALIPLRYAGRTFGLIQFNDRRAGRASPSR